MKKLILAAILGLLLISGLYACPVYRIIGIPCPACGITRAYRLFLSGRIAEAFSMHPLFLLPLIFLFKPCRRRWALISAAALFVAVYLIRFCLLFPEIPPFNYNYNSLIGVFIK